MIKVDNFDIINRLLSYNSGDDFFYLEIIKRRKDNPDLPRSEKTIKKYYLTQGDLSKYKTNIIEACKLNNARAYINLNRRNFKDVAYEMNYQIAFYLKNKQYNACKGLFDTCCGKINSDKNKKWVLDIDTKDREMINKYAQIVNDIRTSDESFAFEIPTINGVHIISSPFNHNLFAQECEIAKLRSIEIHKDNPTLLYFEGESNSITDQIVNNTKSW